MAKEFKDPIEVKQRADGAGPWTYNAPPYDHRSSESISCGNDYGMGYRTPVGKFKASSIEKGPIPQKEKCFKVRDFLRDEDKKG